MFQYKKNSFILKLLIGTRLFCYRICTAILDIQESLNCIARDFNSGKSFLKASSFRSNGTHDYYFRPRS